LPYELIIRSNTIISNLGVFNLKMKIRAVQPEMVNFSEISEHLNSCVRKYLRMYTHARMRVHITHIHTVYP